MYRVRCYVVHGVLTKHHDIIASHILSNMIFWSSPGDLKYICCFGSKRANFPIAKDRIVFKGNSQPRDYKFLYDDWNRWKKLFSSKQIFERLGSLGSTLKSKLPILFSDNQSVFKLISPVSCSSDRYAILFPFKFACTSPVQQHSNTAYQLFCCWIG